jgi:hypothetical protein
MREFEESRLSLSLEPELLSVCRLPAGAAVPESLLRESFVSITRTAEELSIVCRSAAVPAGAAEEGPWRALKVAGPLDFSLTGILTSLTRPLAEAGISVFALSTYDTDYLLVPAEQAEAAMAALEGAQ